MPDIENLMNDINEYVAGTVASLATAREDNDEAKEEALLRKISEFMLDTHPTVVGSMYLTLLDMAANMILELSTESTIT